MVTLKVIQSLFTSVFHL